MEDRYRHIQSAAHKYGDRHYRAMNDWLAAGARPNLERRCRETAIAYRRSLDNLLAALYDLPQTVEVERAVASALEFRSLITTDLQMLDSPQPTRDRSLMSL